MAFMYCNIFRNFPDQCETDRKTNGTLLKTGGETLKERKPLSKIDRHSCRRLRRFLILESCNAYISSICSIHICMYMNTYLWAIAAILLIGRVERASTAARFWGRFELLKKLWKHAWAPHRHIIVIIKIIIINCSDAVSGWAAGWAKANINKP